LHNPAKSAQNLNWDFVANPGNPYYLSGSLDCLPNLNQRSKIDKQNGQEKANGFDFNITTLGNFTMSDSTSNVQKDVIADTRDMIAQAVSTVALAIAALFRAGNVRGANCLQIPGMIASIKRNGYNPDKPLVVSAKPDGRYLVLRGNRRLEAIETIAASEPETFARLFPSGTIPCVVYHDLTTEQEALLRVDHSRDFDTVPLDEFSEFLAIKQLVKAGYLTESGIAEKLGKFKKDSKTGAETPNRSWVQPRVALARLPQFVQDEYQKLWESGSASTPVRVSMILKPLSKTFNEEYATYPNGDGPQFAKVWAECLTMPEAAADKPKALTQTEMVERSKVVGSRIVRDSLMVCAGIAENVNLADVDGRAVQAETALVTLAEINAYLGDDDFAELIAKSQEQAKAQVAETTAAAG
jgi:ParB-like nuclease family protein